MLSGMAETSLQQAHVPETADRLRGLCLTLARGLFVIYLNILIIRLDQPHGRFCMANCLIIGQTIFETQANMHATDGCEYSKSYWMLH